MKHKKIIKSVCLIVLLISSSADAISMAEARHLWSRTGFSQTELLVNNHQNMSRKDAIKSILGMPFHEPPLGSLPEFDNTVYSALKSKDTSKKEKQKIKKNNIKKDKKILQSWWYTQILNTTNPLQEKMTVFWHNHFTSDLQKVFAPYMLKQNQIFRQNALGNFGDMLYEFMHDPAIHYYLDNIKNKKQNPNENLARELLELFTLGEGEHYSEQDIKNIAKALTGYRINYKKQKLDFKKRQHDSSFVKIFDSSGSYTIDGVIKLILSHPKTAEFVTEKLWREYISENPEKNEIKRISENFRESGYEIKLLISELLHSEYFWDVENYDSLIKSPFDLLTSTTYLLNINNSDTNKLPALLANAGQKLFFPPDVRGWRGGTYWLSTELIIARKNMLKNYLKRVIKLNKKTNQKYLSMISDRLTSDRQFFAIGETIPKNITKPIDKLIYLLLHDKFNFK